MFIKAYAEVSETTRYNRAQAQQSQRQLGVTARQANAIVRGNANGAAPFSGRGRRSNPGNVVNRAISGIRRMRY